MLEVAVAIPLGLWLISSVVNQLPVSWKTPILRHDHFSLIPKWTFFAPNPGCTDYHVLYRDVYNDSSLGEWQEIDLAEHRSLITMLWNPRKRIRKAVSDMIQGIVQINPSAQGAVLLSMPYLALLNVAFALPRQAGAEGRQFLVVQTTGFDLDGQDPEVVFRSEMHPFV